MKRREFISLLGGAAAAWPLAARAQQSDRVRRIGVLMNTSDSDPESQVRIAAFQQGMEKLGWTIGRNIQIDYRWGIGDVERTRAAAAELLRLAPDVILSNATTATAVLQQATRTIPIVFVVVSEPVALGFVESLARPGGNMTGFAYLEPSLGAKWLELLKEIAPRITRVAIIYNPKTAPNAALFSRSAEMAAKRFAIDPITISLDEASGIEPIMTSVGREPGHGLIFPPDTFSTVHRKLIVELAARHQLPAIYFQRPFTSEGGLVSYGADIPDLFRRAASYLDRILRGEKPADLPVQQPTKFELVINLKTAKALGLDVPPMLLALADEVIE
jgi:putative ABC transport system substrate-binding protein